MSALHYGRFEVVTNGGGRPVYTGRVGEYPVHGWTKPASAQVPALIPAQRRNSNAFGRELLGDTRTAREVRS